MQKSNAPTKLTVAFASGTGAGPVNNVPLTPGATPGTASYQTGFTSVNMEPIASGGVPPFGADFNGIIQNATQAQIWQQSGFTWTFDSTFSGNANIGGYPAQSVLMMGSGNGLWINKTDNNTTNPDAAGTSGWLGLPAVGAYTISTTGGTTTPSPSVLGVTTLLVTGALTSNATLVLPLSAGSRWIVANNTTGAFTLTVHGSSGAGVSIAQGSALTCFTDGAAYFATSANLSGAYLPIDGTAVAATKLAIARNFSVTGFATASAVSFDGTGNVVFDVTALNVADALGYTPANDADVVHLTGIETITGTKQFQAPSDDYANLVNFGPPDPNKKFYIATQNGSLKWVSSGWYGIAKYQWVTGGGNMTLDYNGNLSTSGTITGSNLSGVNTGDQDLTPYALLSGAAFVGAVGVQIITGKHILFNNDGVNNAIISEPVGGGGYLPLYMYVSSLNVTGALGATTGSFSGDVGCEALTCTTMNASGSDRRLKRDIKKFDPRPLHRTVPFVSYTLKENGWHGLGAVAQNMQKIAPEHVGEFDWHGKRRLSINYAGAAYEQAIWAGRELDRQAKLIAMLERRLAKLESRK